jgi:hypothetical protein
LDDLPSIELLREAHSFPGAYVFKAIGRSDDGFAARVVAAVRDELKLEIDPPYRCREAVGGRHVAVTLEPVLESAEAVLAVYRRLMKTPGLVLLF